MDAITTARKQKCGNGIVTGQEVCDDGNVRNGDGCDNNCQFSGCGNGLVTGLEECDDNNFIDGDGCDNNCRFTGCGNGNVTGDEECDDGNTHHRNVPLRTAIVHRLRPGMCQHSWSNQLVWRWRNRPRKWRTVRFGRYIPRQLCIWRCQLQSSATTSVELRPGDTSYCRWCRRCSERRRMR